MNTKEYQCEDKSCGYTSPKTHLVIFDDVEHRFCAKCYLKFLEGAITKVPAAIELPTKAKK